MAESAKNSDEYNMVLPGGIEVSRTGGGVFLSTGDNSTAEANVALLELKRLLGLGENGPLEVFFRHP